MSQAAGPPAEGEAPGQRFEFGAGDGTTEDGTTEVSQSRLEAGRGTATFDAAAVATAAGTDGVSAAVGVLALESTTFSGEIPQPSTTDGSTADGGAMGGAPADGAAPPAGGPDGAGGSAFGIDSLSVLGYDTSAAAVGPLTAATLTDGRSLTADDADQLVAVIDAAYATSAELAVGDTVELAGQQLEVVGIVTSTATDGSSASDVYVPLGTAQTLSGLTEQVSSVYVQAASADGIAAVKTALEAALPDQTVNTQEDLASNVSGSLSTAAGLVTGLGTWLSIAVLAAAFLLAILFTVSGIARRTRDFGTLKAIGWSDRRIVGQVAGESLVQGGIGGAVGVAFGLIGVLIVNLVAPTLQTGETTTAAGPGGPGGGMPGGFGEAAQSVATSDVVLSLPVTAGVVLLAVGLAALGGVLAGAIGGWRAARLRPAEAFRSVA